MSIRSELEKFPLITVSKKIKKANSLIPRNTQWLLYVAALILSDAMMTLIAFWVVYDLRFVTFKFLFDQTATVSFSTYLFLLFSLPFLWLVIFAVNGLYAKDNLLGGTQEYSIVFRSAGEGFLLIVIAGFLEPNLVIARGWLLMAWTFTFFFVAVSRFWLRRLVYSLRRLGFFLTPAVIVGANQEGRWGYNFFRRNAEDILQHNLAELFPPDCVESQKRTIEEIFEDNVSKHLICPVMVNGGEYWLSTNFSGLQDEFGKVSSILGIARDITERRKMEEQMYHTEKLASLGTMAAGVAHEINNPLAIILGFTEMLAEKVPPDSEFYEILKTMEKQGLNAQRIVSNLLGFARFSKPKEEEIDINQNIQAVLPVEGNTINLNNISMQKDLSQLLPTVKGDSGELQQVFRRRPVPAVRGEGFGNDRIRLHHLMELSGLPRCAPFPSPGALLLARHQDHPGRLPERAEVEA